MGSGLAKQIREKCPVAYAGYTILCNRNRQNPENLLGTVQFVDDLPNRVVVANCFAQVRFGRDKQYTDYEALAACMTAVRAVYEYTNTIIRIPYGIGCGLAGGNWTTVYENILVPIFAASACQAEIWKLWQM